MTRPRVVLVEPMYHPAGEELLQQHCEVRILRSPTAGEIIDAAATAHALAARYPHRVDEALLSAATRLVIVACSGRGTDAIDMQAATRHGVVVVNNPGFGQRPVSEAAIALMLALGKGLFAGDASMRRGSGWRHREDLSQFLEFEGKTLGIVGLGEIGSETARKAIAAFHMNVLAYDPYVPASKAEKIGATKVDSLDTLLAESDVVSMHPELNAETRGMIGEPQLRCMRSTAFLVNTARGKVVRQTALVRALRERWIAGAALDVYEDEPVEPESPLYGLDNILLMPHVAGLTPEAVEGMSRSAARQILQALAGERPPHILNRDAWPAAAARARAAALTF